MAAVKINNFTTTCIRIHIGCDARKGMGAQSGEQVASILRELAEKFEAGENPMMLSEVSGVDVDYL